MTLNRNGYDFDKLTPEQWAELETMMNGGIETFDTLNNWGILPPFMCGVCGDQTAAAQWLAWAIEERKIYAELPQRPQQKGRCCN